MKRHLFLWHRRIGVLILVPLLLFSLSGVLHPTMRVLRPEPAQRFYPAPVWPDALPDRFYTDYRTLTGIRPVKLGERWLQQLWSDVDQSSVFQELQTGQPVEAGAALYAEQLARHFTGDHQHKVQSVQFVTAFSADYPDVNRLLPVWRVQFDREDGLRAYVDIRHDRLGALSDHRRARLMTLFQTFHNWSFLPATHPLRTPLLVLAMGAGGLMALSGVYLLLVLPIRQRNVQALKKWHRYIGGGIALLLFAFCLSGLMRTLDKQTPELRGVARLTPIDLDAVTLSFSALKQQVPNLNGAVLHELEGRPVWQVLQPRQPDLWLDAQTAALIPQGGQRYAQSLLAGLIVEGVLASPKVALSQTQWITDFKTDEHYGFIDKRLPVLALTHGRERFYFDLRAGVLSKQLNDKQRVDAWIFRYLHKWRFADGLGVNGRDSLMVFTLLLIALTALFGGWSWQRQKRKTRKHREQVAVGQSQSESVV